MEPIEEIIQGSDAWKKLRLGKVTASKVADIMAKGKGGAESASAKNYRAALVCERLTGQAEETYCNGAMQRGTEMEPLARECYEFVRGVDVKQVAFIDHPTIQMAGASPDGLVGEDGLVEIKAPNTSTHIEYLLGKVPPSQYIPQMLFQMACTGRAWCDFVSYDPRLPEDLQLFVTRLNRDESKIAEMESAVIAFQQTVDEMILRLRAIRG